MSLSIERTLDFNNNSKIVNLPNAVNPQEPATLSQLLSAIEGLAQKDNVRVSTQGNISLASPGAAIDGISMNANDRVLVRAQTTQTENGIYVWNGAAVPMTRSLDSNTFDEIENALVPVDEGTNAGQVWRQTAVNGVIDTNNILFAQFGTSSAQATETSSGVAEIATQAETDAGSDDARFITPLKLASSPYAKKQFAANIGDGSATSITVTHNLNTLDVTVEVFRNSGNRDTILVEIQRTTVNSVTILFTSAPASNAFRALIRA